MKKMTSFIGVLLFATALLANNGANAQDKKMKRTITKNIEVNDENGEKTVTVTTTTDGDKKVSVIKGAEADKYLASEKPGHVKNMNSHGIIVTEENGVKKVTITKEKDGKKEVRELVGEEAENFLKRQKARAMLKKGDKGKHKSVEREIEVSDENGEKTVTVTTTREGKKVVKTLTGDKADKFLKEHKRKHAAE
jgi:hypothetical protein